MKKYLLIPLAVVLIVGLILSGCAQPTPPAEKITLRLSNGLAITTFQNETILPTFAAEVAEKTGGMVTIELYPAKELYGHIDGVEALVAGAVEMTFSSSDHFVGYNPLHGWSIYGFLVRDIPTFQENEAEVSAIIKPLYEGIGVKCLAYVPYSSVCLTTTKVPIEKPEDCEGLRIRGISDPFFHTIEAWGGVPAAMSPDEAYDAAAKGALDGIMSSWQSITARKWYEIADYAFGTTSASMWGIFINKQVWDGLPKDVQAAIEEAAQNAHDTGLSGQMAIDVEARETLKGYGMNVKVLTAAEAAVWREATRPAYARWLGICTDAGYGDQCKQLLALFGE